MALERVQLGRRFASPTKAFEATAWLRFLRV